MDVDSSKCSFVPTKDVGSRSSCNESILVMATPVQSCQHNQLSIQMWMLNFKQARNVCNLCVSMWTIWGIKIEKDRMWFKYILDWGRHTGTDSWERTRFIPGCTWKGSAAKISGCQARSSWKYFRLEGTLCDWAQSREADKKEAVGQIFAAEK